MRSLFAAIALSLLVIGAVCQDPVVDTHKQQQQASSTIPQVVADPAEKQRLTELFNTVNAQKQELQSVATKLESVKQQADKQTTELSQQHNQLQSLQNALQQQSSSGSQLSQALKDIQSSVSELQQKLKAQQQADQQEHLARASAATDERLTKLESNLANVKSLLSEVSGAVAKEQERLASLTDKLAKDHDETQARIALLVQSIKNSTSSSFGESLCAWYHQHVQPYTKELFTSAGSLGQKASEAIELAVKWGGKQDPNVLYKSAVDASLKLWKNANAATEKFLVNAGIPAEHTPLASKIAVGAAALSTSLVTLILARVLLSLFFRVLFFPCRLCCGSSSKKSSVSVTDDVPAESSKESSSKQPKKSGARPPAQRS